MKTIKISSLIKYNVLYLGSLLFTLIFLGAIAHRGRLESGSGWSWSHPYLDSYIIAGLFLLILAISLISYVYAFYKTYQKTKIHGLLSRTRIIAFLWLISAPIVVWHSGVFWLNSMRILTDRLFFN